MFVIICKIKNEKLTYISSKYGLAPNAPYTNTKELLQEAYKISKKYNVPIAMHLVEVVIDGKIVMKNKKLVSGDFSGIRTIQQ